VIDPDLVDQIMQQYVSGLMSRKTAIEQIGFVKDVDEEIRRLEEEEDARAKRFV
jgi:hypothetical protein